MYLTAAASNRSIMKASKDVPYIVLGIQNTMNRTIRNNHQSLLCINNDANAKPEDDQ